MVVISIMYKQIITIQVHTIQKYVSVTIQTTWTTKEYYKRKRHIVRNQRVFGKHID